MHSAGRSVTSRGPARRTVSRCGRAAGVWRALLTALCVLFAAAGVQAQPDPRQMSGIPRPDPSLADGSITVRVIRGSFANNVTGHPVELRAGDAVATTETDEEGRATFSSLSPAAQVTVSTTLDGQTLVSQPFAAPGRGGVAVLLVGAGAGGDPVNTPPARPGQVTLGRDSRIQIELVEESVEVYYLLDVINVADGPVEPQTPFEFTLPSTSQGATILQGSSPRTLVDGPRVSVSGGFEPGPTPVRVAYVLPYSGGSLALSQMFPADFEQLLLFVEKWGAMDFTSALVERRGEMAADVAGGSPLLWGAGGRIPSGRAVELELSGLPHHNRWPRIIALSISGVIVVVSVWGSSGGGGADPAAQGLEALRVRRETLFTALVRIERQYRQGKIGAARHGTRRAELMAQLQQVLRDLDERLAPAAMAASTAPDEATA